MFIKNFFLDMLRLVGNERGNLSLTGGGEPSADVGTGDVVPTEPVAPTADVPAGGGDLSLNEPVGTNDILEGLEEAIKSDPSLKVFEKEDGSLNLQNLVKSYVSAQKKIGEKGVQLPGENSTDEEIADFHNKIRPADLKDYDIKSTLGEKQVLDEEMFKGFKEIAHKEGMTPKQAQTVLDWYNTQTLNIVDGQDKTNSATYDKEVAQLKSDWGEATEKNMHIAQRALKEFASEDELRYMQDTGLDKNVTLIRLLNKVGSGLMEDTFDPGKHGAFGKSREDAQREIDTTMGNMESPYWKADHPNHKRTVEDMAKLMEAANRA